MRYGVNSMSWNGCELIAIYNARLLIGKATKLSSIAFEFESNHYQLAYGYFGTNPYNLGWYFSSHNINYKYTTKLSTLKSWLKRGCVYIISFWNTKRTRDGAHTIAVRCEWNGSLTAYNNGRLVPTTSKSFEEIIGGGSFIAGYNICF